MHSLTDVFWLTSTFCVCYVGPVAINRVGVLAALRIKARDVLLVLNGVFLCAQRYASALQVGGVA